MKTIDKIIMALPAHIWGGIAVLLFGLALVVLFGEPFNTDAPVEPVVTTQNA